MASSMPEIRSTDRLNSNGGETPAASPNTSGPGELPAVEVTAASPTNSPKLGPEAQQSPQQTEQQKAAKGILVIFVILKVLVSYDSGAFSAVLGADNGITDDLELTTSQQGALGSTVFLGNTVGCAIAGHLFSHYSAKPLMTGSLAAHTLLTFLFGISNLYEVDMVIRFLLGVTLAFIVVYSPIWVDEFAPKSSATLWMALCNAGVPIGIMIGFVVGGMLPTNTTLSWRWAFYLKALLMVPLTMYFNSLDRKLIDCRDGHFENGGSMSIEPGWALFHKLVAIVKSLVSNGLLMANIMALCSLYFVVTALQTFVTPYLRGAPFFASMNTIVLGFGGAVVTAPVLGVIVGGVMLDRIGGYHRNLLKASMFELGWGVLAGIIGFVCMTTSTAASFLIVVWVLLFCGGAIVPAATGIIMASIEEKRRAAASSFSAICFNLFGYFSGPLVCGVVADSYGLVWGIRTAFIVSFIGIIPMLLACYFARTHVTPQPASNNVGPNGAVDGGESGSGEYLQKGDEEGSSQLAGEGPRVVTAMPIVDYDGGAEMTLVKKSSSLRGSATIEVPPVLGGSVTMVGGTSFPRSPMRQGMPLGARDRLEGSITSRSPATEIADLDMDRVSNSSIHMFPNQYAGALDFVSHLHEVDAAASRERSASAMRSSHRPSAPVSPGLAHSITSFHASSVQQTPRHSNEPQTPLKRLETQDPLDQP